MVIRISEALAAAVKDAREKNLSANDILVELAKKTPMQLAELRVPGEIAPTFDKEKEADMSLGEVFGDTSMTAMLEKSVEKIRAGAYRLRTKLATELGVSPEGCFARAEWAAFLFVRQCLCSSDKAVKEWAAGAIVHIGPRLNLTNEEVAEMKLDDIKQRLIPPPEVEEPEQGSEKSWGAQGQTRKPGSHGESRHR